MKRLKEYVWSWLLVAAGVTIFILWQYNYEKKVVVEGAVETLKQAAQAVKYILPHRYHHVLTNAPSWDVQTRNTKLLTAFAGERDLHFLYSFVERGTNLTLTAASLHPDGTLENPLSHYSNSDELLKLACNKPGLTYEESSDGDKEFLAVFWTRGEGEGRWVAAAEYEGGLYEDRLDSAILRALWSAVYLLAFAFVLQYPRYRKLQKERDMYRQESIKHQDLINRLLQRGLK